ncbi:MAG TPA: hypothetical protein DCZ04_13200 [Syntrophorhabdus aromaticivorans]|nr:hypothetical protein [Syntrophorhabdus aromaticivorans]
MLFPHSIFWTSWTKIAPSGDRKGPPGNVVVDLGHNYQVDKKHTTMLDKSNIVVCLLKSGKH